MKLLYMIFFMVCIMIPLNSLALNYGKKKEYPVVTTAKYEFMDSVVSIIKNTNLRLIYSFFRSGLDKVHNTIDFRYQLTVYIKDNNTNEWELPSYRIKKQDFQADGTYLLTVSAYLFIPDTDSNIFNGYVFNYNGMTFFSDTYLNGFFKRVIRKTPFEYLFETGSGYNWTFKIEHGKIVEAYAFFSFSEIPFKVLDIINKKILDYDPNLKLY